VRSAFNHSGTVSAPRDTEALSDRTRGVYGSAPGRERGRAPTVSDQLNRNELARLAQPPAAVFRLARLSIQVDEVPVASALSKSFTSQEL
jgi:hypothetical protein